MGEIDQLVFITALTPDRISSKCAYECHSRPIRIDRKMITKHS